MFKQEDFNLLGHEYSPPDSNDQFEYRPPNSNDRIEEYILNPSPPYDINNININDIMPMMQVDSLNGNMLILSPQQLEETMDVAKLEGIEFCPVSPRGPPARAAIASDVDFQVEINASDTHKRKYLYSNQLNRIYVDMKVNFPISFRWSPTSGPSPAYVRATVVFSDESQAEKRVERCTQHTHETSNSILNQEIVKNVLHSSRELGTHGVYYCGQPELADSWYSVLVQMAAGGHGTHAYQFVCKNSCSSGINRRAIDVIFTLEDASGRVYGRQTVGARVCACPRRDMVRDEETEVFKSGKRRVQGNRVSQPACKKVKTEAVDGKDDTVLTLPPVQIVGVRPVITGLEVMLSMMQQAAALSRGDADKYAAPIAALKAKIDELKKTPA